jgi:hypothetical protein
MADAEPLVPLVAPASVQAISLSAALRQASIDVPRDLPAGVHLTAHMGEQDARVVVTVAARNVYGVAVWEQRYDGTGRRLALGAGVTW